MQAPARVSSRRALLTTGFGTATQRRRPFSDSSKQIRDAYILSAARTPTAKVKPIAFSITLPYVALHTHVENC
jgi:hypothetical protein